MLRIVFMGTPEFAVPALEAISRAHNVLCVYTQPDRPGGRGLRPAFSAVKKKALSLGLSVRQPEKLSGLGEFENISGLAPDVIVVVAYGQILKTNVLKLPKIGCVNIHSSLLPRWRGAAPIQWAILSGDRETGVTTMFMAEKLDTGDILLQEKTEILPHDTAGTLHDRLSGMAARFILQTLDGLAKGSIKPRQQDERLATYASKLNKEMEHLAPGRESAEVLDRKIRALSPWPGTSVNVRLDEKIVRLKIKRAKLRPEISGQAGHLFERAGEIFLVTPEGSLELLAVQWDGKNEVDASAFLNGLKGRGYKLPLSVC